MNPAATIPLLERVPLLHSLDLEATRAFYAVKGTDFQPIRTPKGGAHPFVRVNGLYLPNLWFGYVEYSGAGAALRLSAHSSSFRAVDQKKAGGALADRQSLGDYYLYVPLRGRIEAEIPGQIIDCSPAQ